MKEENINPLLENKKLVHLSLLTEVSHICRTVLQWNPKHNLRLIIKLIVIPIPNFWITSNPISPSWYPKSGQPLDSCDWIPFAKPRILVFMTTTSLNSIIQPNI